MKIKTSKLLAVLCTLAMMVATFVPMLTIAATAADATYSYTFTAKQYTANGQENLGNVNWTLAGDGGYWGYDATKGQQLGSSGSPYKSMTLTSASFSNVTEIVINTSGASKIDAKLTVSVGDKQIGDTISLTTSATNYTFTPSTPLTGEVVLSYTQTSAKAIYIKSISVTYSEGGSTEPDVPACKHEPTDEGVVTEPTCTTAGYTTYTCSKCGEEYMDKKTEALNHKNTTTTTIDATCTENGSTTVTCKDCGKIMSTTTIPAAHNYENKVCTECGKVQPNESTGTLTFDNTSKRTQFTTSIQVWTENGITLTNNKASSTTNVGNYSNPLRMYKNSEVIISAGGNLITKIVFDTAGISSDYSTPVVDAIKNAGYTVSSNNGIHTILIPNGTDNVTLVLSTGQGRLNKIEVTYVPAECQHENQTTTTTEATCTQNGTKTVVCDDCGATIKTEEIPATGHKIEGNVCTVCNEEFEDYSGRYYIATIRSSGNYFYMTSALVKGKTERYQAVDSHLTTLPSSITSPVANQIFVITRNDDGTYHIQAEDVKDNNYLGWTSDNSGTLVSKEDAKSFKVDLLESGLFNIHFTGDAERYLALNNQSGNDYFAFYAGTQKQDLALIPVVETPAGKITNASLELGTDLSFNFRVTLAEGEDFANFTMSFTLDTNTVEGVTSTDGVFTINGIAPHQMGDTVTATLYKNGEAVDTIEYSIATYLNTVISGAQFTANDKALAEALLIYGAAAQKHQNYKTDALVTDETPVVDSAPESNLEMTQNSAKLEGLTFKTVGVHFNYVNKLYITLENTNNVENVTVKVNGVETEIVDGKVYTGAVAPTKFGTVYTFVLCVNGEAYQTVTYSVNSYINKKWTEDTGLAKALYNYAVAFAEYKNQ